MPKFIKNDTVLIYSLHRTDDWWRHVGQNMGFSKSVVVSDLRGDGDICIVDDFYEHQKVFYKNQSDQSSLLTKENVNEIIARCRLLRFMPSRRAKAMTLGMAAAFNIVLKKVNPAVIVSWPIDRYVSDVLEYIARAKGIPYFEITASALPEMSMLLQKGVLCKRDAIPNPKTILHNINELTAPLFTPTYVQGKSNFTLLRFLRIFLYFRMRAIAFRLISWWKRDPLNLHYLDAQSFLGHKPKLSDHKTLQLVDKNWRDKLANFSKEKRIFFGLQLFPEASIDYWIHDLELIKYENLIFETAQAFSKAQYLVLIKDHPLQFGFRQVGLINKLLALPNVVLVPYEISGNEVLSKCGVNFTCTGTLGLQAALIGLKSVVTESYYTTKEDFILLTDVGQVKDLPKQVANTPSPANLPARQKRIIENLLRGSFKSDFFSFQDFSTDTPSQGANEIGEIIGKQIRNFMAE